MSRPHLLLLLFVSLPLVLACGSRQTYYKTSVVGVVPVLSPEWVWQQGSMILMSDSQLERMALHARNPAHRVMAFDKLASKRSQRCLDILLANLTDTSSLKVQWFDLTLDTDVSSHTLQVAEDDSLLFTKEQRHHIDSVIVFGSGMDHLYRLPSALRLIGTEGAYERIRELCAVGDPYLLQALAEYRQPADIPLIINALLKDKELFIDPENHLEELGQRTINDVIQKESALEAILEWRDEAFIPALDAFRDPQLLHSGLGPKGVRLFIRCVMGYDNEWAYHLIEDLFEKGGKKMAEYAEPLYVAYYKENEPVRFLPLIEKYGKQPYDWESGASFLYD